MSFVALDEIFWCRCRLLLFPHHNFTVWAASFLGVYASLKSDSPSVRRPVSVTKAPRTNRQSHSIECYISALPDAMSGYKDSPQRQSRRTVSTFRSKVGILIRSQAAMLFSSTDAWRFVATRAVCCTLCCMVATASENRKHADLRRGRGWRQRPAVL